MIYESFIISKIIRFLKFLLFLYNESAFASIVRKIGLHIKEYLAYSNIWNFIKRKDFFTKTWGSSVIFKGLESLINIPVTICKKTCIKDILYESKILKLLNLLLSRFEIVLGILFAFIVIIPNHKWYAIYGVIIVLTLAILLFFKIIYNDREGLSIRGADFALMIFLLSSFMAFVTSLYPRQSLNHIVLYLTCFLLVLIIVNSIKTGRRLNTFVEIFLLGITITVLYGLWQWKVVGIAVNPSITDVRLNPGLVRVYSTMGNENIYGALLVLALPLFLSVVFNSIGFVKKAIYLSLFALSIVGLVLTGSRSAWISFAVSMFVLLFFKKRKLIPVFIILGVLCIPLLPPPIYRRVMSIFNSNDKSISTRGSIYKMATPMLKDYWLTGVGLGAETFQSIFKRYQTFGATNYAHTHNLYLQIWLESGIIAILSFVWFIVRIIKKSLNEIFGQFADSYIKNILIAGLASIAGILVMGMAEHVWFFNRILLIFWMTIGIIMAGLSISLSKQRSLMGE